jgi:hypothetical protein
VLQEVQPKARQPFDAKDSSNTSREERTNDATAKVVAKVCRESKLHEEVGVVIFVQLSST